MTTTPNHRDILTALEALKGDLKELSDRIGCEVIGPDGRIGGTGLTGRVIRTEARVLAYDRLKERVIGGLLTGSALMAVLWWIVRQKVASVFGVAS